MDHSHQEPEPNRYSAAEIAPSLEENDRSDVFPDEPDGSGERRIPPNADQHQRFLQHGSDENCDAFSPWSLRCSMPDTRSNKEQLSGREHPQGISPQHHDTSGDTFVSKEESSSLPLILRLLFGLNGLTLSVLTLPIMYVLNTRVEVPLPYLPTYGAIAFLPYSLKPMYAYLCGILSTTPRRNNNNNIINNNNDSHSASVRGNRENDNTLHNHRYLPLFRVLLTFNSACTLLFATIPSGGVVAVFVVAFLRGLTDSWAEFCLGLTLIDHARSVASSASKPYEIVVSGLQAEATTATNLGSWLGSFLIFLVLAWRRFATSSGESPQLTGGLANALVIATALLQLSGAGAVAFFEKTETKSVTVYEELPTVVAAVAGQRTRTEVGAVLSTESASLMDEEEGSHPSYSSLEDLVDDDDDRSILSTEDSIFRTHSPSFSDYNNPLCSSARISSGLMVFLLQCVLVAFALKGPIVEISSHFVWSVLISTLHFSILVAAVALYCNNTNSSGDSSSSNNVSSNTYRDNPTGHSHKPALLRVGLYLVLRNTIPSDSSVIASFFYSLFGTNQPLLLQFLSFLGMGVSSLSSWSYTLLFAKRFASGHPLFLLLTGMVVVASLTSLLHIAVFRVYQHDKDESGDEFSTSRKLLIIAVLSKFVTTFFDEWAFLPELVLATSSVKVPTTMTRMPSSSTDVRHDNETGESGSHKIIGPFCPADDPCQGTTAATVPPHHRRNEDDHLDHNKALSEERIAMEYGTLVSCIDFGDQLGSLAAAPLVAFWNISRDNGFLHLDRLVLFCVVANVVISIGLLPLLWTVPNKKR